MPTHEYTAQQALDLLVEKVDSQSTELAKRIRLAIDAGSETQIEEEPQLRHRRGPKVKTRFYRKTVPYTPEEAVSVAVGVLLAHLLESRVAVQKAFIEFTAAAMGPPRKPTLDQDPTLFESPSLEGGSALEPTTEGSGVEKIIEIETEPETVRERTGQSNLLLKPVDPRELEVLRGLMQVIAKLTTFKEGQHGNASGS